MSSEKVAKVGVKKGEAARKNLMATKNLFYRFHNWNYQRKLRKRFKLMDVKVIKCAFCKNIAEWELYFRTDNSDTVFVCVECVGGFPSFRKISLEAKELLKQEEELFKRRDRR